MGGPAWQFKKFADASSRPWLSQAWRNKLAAGFTNSASVNGDKFSTIEYFWTLSQQHGQIWIGTRSAAIKYKGARTRRRELDCRLRRRTCCFAVRRLARRGSTRRRSGDR